MIIFKLNVQKAFYIYLAKEYLKNDENSLLCDCVTNLKYHVHFVGNMMESHFHYYY